MEISIMKSVMILTSLVAVLTSSAQAQQQQVEQVTLEKVIMVVRAQRERGYDEAALAQAQIQTLMERLEQTNARVKELESKLSDRQE